MKNKLHTKNMELKTFKNKPLTLKEIKETLFAPEQGPVDMSLIVNSDKAKLPLVLSTDSTSMEDNSLHDLYSVTFFLPRFYETGEWMDLSYTMGPLNANAQTHAATFEIGDEISRTTESSLFRMYTHLKTKQFGIDIDKIINLHQDKFIKQYEFIDNLFREVYGPLKNLSENHLFAGSRSTQQLEQIAGKFEKQHCEADDMGLFARVKALINICVNTRERRNPEKFDNIIRLADQNLSTEIAYLNSMYKGQ